MGGRGDFRKKWGVDFLKMGWGRGYSFGGLFIKESSKKIRTLILLIHLNLIFAKSDPSGHSHGFFAIHHVFFHMLTRIPLTIFLAVFVNVDPVDPI